jgi:hypothetical protein
MVELVSRTEARAGEPGDRTAIYVGWTRNAAETTFKLFLGRYNYADRHLWPRLFRAARTNAMR